MASINSDSSFAAVVCQNFAVLAKAAAKDAGDGGSKLQSMVRTLVFHSKRQSSPWTPREKHMHTTSDHWAHHGLHAWRHLKSLEWPVATQHFTGALYLLIAAPCHHTAAPALSMAEVCLGFSSLLI